MKVFFCFFIFVLNLPIFAQEGKDGRNFDLVVEIIESGSEWQLPLYFEVSAKTTAGEMLESGCMGAGEGRLWGEGTHSTLYYFEGLRSGVLSVYVTFAGYVRLGEWKVDVPTQRLITIDWTKFRPVVIFIDNAKEFNGKLKGIKVISKNGFVWESEGVEGNGLDALKFESSFYVPICTELIVLKKLEGEGFTNFGTIPDTAIDGLLDVRKPHPVRFDGSGKLVNAVNKAVPANRAKSEKEN